MGQRRCTTMGEDLDPLRSDLQPYGLRSHPPDADGHGNEEQFDPTDDDFGQGRRLWDEEDDREHRDE